MASHGDSLLISLLGPDGIVQRASTAAFVTRSSSSGSLDLRREARKGVEPSQQRDDR
jgi:hypothetical protein